MASRGFPVVLALEVETPWWPAEGATRITPADPRDEQSQIHSGARRASTASFSSSASISVRPAWPSIWSGVEGRRPKAGTRSSAIMPTASRRWICSRADDLVSFALRPADHGAWPAEDSMVWRYTASDRGMDRKSDHGILWLGTSSPLPNPRSGWGLWRGLHPTASINGYSRLTDVAALPMAKRIC